MDYVNIFVTYSHRDKRWMEEIKRALAGLTKNNARFWADVEILPGEKWDKAIKSKLDDCHIALALISQDFLDSYYCIEEEIQRFLDRDVLIFPIMLSACDWEDEHAWLGERQIIPPGDQTIAEHFYYEGPRKRLFKDVRIKLKKHINDLFEKQKFLTSSNDNPFNQVGPITDLSRFIGRGDDLERLIENMGRGSVALFGDPKIGKSSLVNAFIHNMGDGFGKVLGPFDFHAYEDRDDFFEDFASSLGVENSKRAIRKALKKDRCILILDEMDAAVSLGFSSGDFSFFRAMANGNPQFKMMTVSRKPIKELFPDQEEGSPGYNLLLPQKVNTMDEDEALELLRHPWFPPAKFSEDQLKAMRAHAGGHPFRLQCAGFHHFKALTRAQYDWKGLSKEEWEAMH